MTEDNKQSEGLDALERVQEIYYEADDLPHTFDRDIEIVRQTLTRQEAEIKLLREGLELIKEGKSINPKKEMSALNMRCVARSVLLQADALGEVK